MSMNCFCREKQQLSAADGSSAFVSGMRSGGGGQRGGRRSEGREGSGGGSMFDFVIFLASL